MRPDLSERGYFFFATFFLATFLTAFLTAGFFAAFLTTFLAGFLVGMEIHIREVSLMTQELFYEFETLAVSLIAVGYTLPYTACLGKLAILGKQKGYSHLSPPGREAHGASFYAGFD